MDEPLKEQSFDILLNITGTDIIDRLQLRKHFVFAEEVTVGQHRQQVFRLQLVARMLQRQRDKPADVNAAFQYGVYVVIVAELAVTRRV